MTLEETRLQYGITQLKASEISGIPLRTYLRYESDNNYGSNLKRKAIIDAINEECEVTETKGLLTIETIKKLVTELFDKEYKNDINYCYLFGSYAKGYAKENSDIDLCVSTDLSGLRFVGLSERLRNTLHKKIDLIRLNNLKGNVELIDEIMKQGIKIYG